MIPAEAVEAALKTLAEYTPDEESDSFDLKANEVWRGKVERILEAAAPYMLSHEREQTRLAHLDAMVNRETKREQLAEAWDEGKAATFNDPIGIAFGDVTNPYRAAVAAANGDGRG